MDVGTQGLASLVIARAFVPRGPWRAWAVIVVAGSIANIDVLSGLAGPSAFVEWHRTYAHSIVVSLIVSAVLAAAYILASSQRVGGAEEKTPARMPALPKAGGSAVAFFAAVILAGLLHVALDAAQSDGTMIFWPLSRQRVALDWLPHIDPWIIAILLAALLLPELTRLVTDEIGAKAGGARGRIGAIVGLVVLALYVGMRADLHSNAIATLQSRGYDSGQPHRVAAYADAGSPFIWHGIVETERALHEPDISIFTSSQFDADNGSTLFKPEPSPILDHAQNSEAARKFLAAARFPKADIEKTNDGYDVELRDLRYAGIGETRREIRARIDLDANGRVLNDELVWARDAGARR
jgi:inner membrane protein